jgi:hypothetical protein
MAARKIDDFTSRMFDAITGMMSAACGGARSPCERRRLERPERWDCLNVAGRIVLVADTGSDGRYDRENR